MSFHIGPLLDGKHLLEYIVGALVETLTKIYRRKSRHQLREIAFNQDLFPKRRNLCRSDYPKVPMFGRQVMATPINQSVTF